MTKIQTRVSLSLHMQRKLISVKIRTPNETKSIYKLYKLVYRSSGLQGAKVQVQVNIKIHTQNISVRIFKDVK